MGILAHEDDLNLSDEPRHCDRALLYDPHIRHVLEAAKKGAGVVQPVCWIAPDVEPKIVRDIWKNTAFVSLAMTIAMEHIAI